MDPLKGVYAQGWAYRHAVSGRSSRLVVAGMWLIFLPVAYCYVRYARSWLLSDPYGKDPNHTWIAILYLAFTVPLILLCGAILMRATLNYIYQARVERGICIKCGHDLHEATEPRCPECGTGFARPEPEE